MTTDYEYQYDFSEMHPELYNLEARQKKANKIVAVLSDCLDGKTQDLNLLDVGSSTGIMTSLISKSFKSGLGIDIDESAVKHAKETFGSDTLDFAVQDSMNMNIEDNSIDVITCSQVYEHVPDAFRLVAEIHRVLKPGGVCYFAAGNRFVLIEQHYRLPLLAAIPKWMAHRYIRLMGKADYYYETHFSYWKLKRLVADFEVIDYTERIVRDPVTFHADDMIPPGSRTQKTALFLTKFAYWLFPTYIWVLKKKG